MKRHNRAGALISGILLLGIGFFLLLVLLDFNVEDSLHFSESVDEIPPHLLGWTGMRISSTFFILLGRGSSFFALILLYTGYVVIRRISVSKKVGYVLLSAASVTLFIGLLATLKNDPVHRGGGLFGRFIAGTLPLPLPAKVLIFVVPLMGILFLLFKTPVLSVYRFVKRSPSSSSRKRVILHEEGQKLSHRENDTANERRASVRRSASPRMRLKRLGTSRSQPSRSRRQLPLFSKVYITEDEQYALQQETGPSRRKKPHPKVHGKRGGESVEGTGSKDTAEPLRYSHRGAISYLRKSAPINKKEQEKETERKALELERTLKEFGIEAKVIGIIRGPVITRYELQPAPGVKLSRIENLSNNIALNLSANGVRIEAPIPGRAAVGIEVPNETREIVTLGDIIDEADKRGELPLVLGKDISGKVVVSDLTSMPHLLIAGATGSGKSVCVNALIMSIISQKGPEDVRLLMIDPKMVELKIYNGIPHLLTEVVSDPRDAAKAFRWVLYEMENRYRLLDENHARNITGYNRKMSDKLPYIVIIVDEFATLMSISQKEVEEAVVRLAAMSRAVGIHLIMATQRPSVDVITGLIKANFPFRIAFQVASKTDSRTILDMIGAEKLLGRGDMLYAPAGSMHLQRIQGAFISEDEVHRIVEELRKKSSPEYVEDIFSFTQDERLEVDFDDPLFEQAVEIVVGTKRASASFLQRRLKIGYNRAARLIELMEEKGIIGPPRGSRPREIYVENLE